MADAGLRQRLIPDSEAPSDWDSDLPYGGKVYLARKKKPDPTYVKVIEASCISIYLLYPMHHDDVYKRYLLHVGHLAPFEKWHA